MILIFSVITVDLWPWPFFSGGSSTGSQHSPWLSSRVAIPVALKRSYHIPVSTVLQSITSLATSTNSLYNLFFLHSPLTLTSGWLFQPLWKYESHLGWWHSQSSWKNNPVMFQSPPTRHVLTYIYIYTIAPGHQSCARCRCSRLIEEEFSFPAKVLEVPLAQPVTGKIYIGASVRFFTVDSKIYIILSLFGYGSKPCTPGEHQNSW